MHQARAIAPNQHLHLGSDRTELLVGHSHRCLGQLDAEQATESTAPFIVGPLDHIAAGGLDQTRRFRFDAKFAKHVTRVMVSNLRFGSMHQLGQMTAISTLIDKRAELIRARTYLAGTFSAQMIARQLEHLRPEHLHHGRAASGRNDNRVGTVVVKRIKRVLRNFGRIPRKT